MGTAEATPDVAAAHETGAFTGEGGRRIAHQAWIPDPVRAVVVVVHGAAEHGGRYAHLLERLVPEGFAVHAPDHRGHGRSEGKRAQIERLSLVVGDVDHVVDLARQRHPGRRVFMVGHSMGGLIAIAYAARHQHKLAGLVLSAPVAALESAPAVLRAAGRAISAVAPNAPLLQLDGSKVSRDPAEVAAYRADPLNHTGKLPARTVAELVGGVGRIKGELAPALTLPLLVLQGSADALVEPAGAQTVHDQASSADKRLRVYDGFYHELFNEPAGERDRPLDATAQWLLDRS